MSKFSFIPENGSIFEYLYANKCVSAVLSMTTRVRKFTIPTLYIALCMTTTSAHAGDQYGTISYVIARSDGLTYFILSGTHNSRPACASSTDWVIVNENSDFGKRQFAMLMAAKAQGINIYVQGKNSCTRWPDSEDVDTVTLFPN